MRNIYVECTNTFVLEYTSGIQRVVKNIITRLEGNESGNLSCLPVLNIEGKSYVVDIRRLDDARWTRRILSVATLARNFLNTIMPEVEPEGSSNGRSLDCMGDRKSFRDLLIKLARKIMFKIFKRAYSADGLIDKKCQVELGSEDLLFVADSFWKENVCNVLVDAKKGGCKTVLLLYDIIAVTHADTVTSRFRYDFVSSLNQVAGNIDGIISISKYSMIEIKRYMDDINPEIEYDYFYLGADFKDFPNENELETNPLQGVFGDSSVYLIVGTVEPRKNHTYVLDAFEKIWAAGMDLHLCIVGREGWLCEEIISRIMSSPQYGRRLRYFPDLDDRGLTYCYRHAKAQVISSVVEGFGLPLVEAMHYGKPVFASDIPVFREIGGTYPEYFNLADPQSLADVICSFEQRDGEAEHQAQNWLSWDESVDDLLRKIESMNERLSAREVTNV